MLSILIIIDGCNEDYINERSMPFLFSVKQKSKYLSMEITPSFATRIELLSGRSPQTTDTFTDFCFGQPILPFRLLKIFPLPKNLFRHKNSINLKPLWRFLYYLKHRTWVEQKDISILTGIYFAFTGIWIDFAKIPISLLPYFSISESVQKRKKTEKLGASDNLMGILKKNGFKVESIYGTAEHINKKMSRCALRDDQVIVLHYGETDCFGHKYGPNSPEVKEVIGSIDKSIKYIYELVESKLEFLVVMGDHNMVEVVDNVDLWQELQQLDAKLAKDYLVFLSSPMARFWFEKEEARKEVRSLLRSLGKYGREVSKDELRQKRLPVNDKYGELIFWANKGINFSPDFYHSSKVKGMHGYFDDSSVTPLLIWSKKELKFSKSRCKMQDVTPTILNLLSVNYSEMDGESLIISN